MCGTRCRFTTTVTAAVGVVAVVGCSGSQQRQSGGDHGPGSPVRASAQPPPPPVRGTAKSLPHRPPSSPSALRKGKEIAARPTPAPLGGDPVASARRYAATVWSYTPATYEAAASALGLATPALAARSRPSATALEQMRTAGQASSVRVTAAGYDPEAASGPWTAYVSVVFTATVSYRGAGSGRPARHVWELRLTRAGGRWLVDAVLGAD